MLNFKEIESKWQKAWEKEKVFKVKEDSKKKKFYNLEMFPYPSGSGLHMGHALNYTIGDIYARFKRMNGYNVLYPMGYDAFGLPAENAAIKAKQHPARYTEESIKNFIQQQKALGLSYDWDRLVVTCHPEYYKWNQYFFLKFYENGLVYRKKAAVNWCPKCTTVLANEQVHSGKCWRHEDTDVEIKQLEQWFIKTTKYSEELLEQIQNLDWPERIKIMQENWIGKSYGTEINFEINGEKWPVFTTRPDTLYGVTFLVIAAQHPKLIGFVSKEQKKEVDAYLKKIKSVSEKELEAMEKEGVFTGSYAVNPLTNEKIPVYAGNFVIADYGSGMVMAVPAHDQRDFEFAKKYGINKKFVICPEEKDFDKQNISYNFSRKDGLGEFGTKKVTGHISMQSRIDSELTETYIENKKRRIKEITEGTYDYCWTGSGNLINSGEFNGVDSDKAIEKITDWLISKNLGKRVTNYKFRDWLVSRQRYWGTPIPMVYCDKCGVVPINEKDLPIILPEKVKFGEGNPLATNQEFVNTKCPKCKGKAKRETDTMDTFFDSSWYYLRYCDNKNSKKPFDAKKVKYWMPVDQYIGGAEHACMHLIYGRFFNKALRDLGFIKFDEPFMSLFNQGMLHGSDGNKMSKNLGNVVNPLEMIEKSSADALRFNLMSLALPDKDSIWNDSSLDSSYKWMIKVENFFENVKIGKSTQKLENKIHKTIKEVTEDIEGFKYNLAIIKIRGLLESFESEKEVSKSDLEIFLKLLHPICPHITEELGHKLGNKNFISLEKWPKYDPKKINEIMDYSEEFIESLRSDIRYLVNLLKLEKPKTITILVSQKWKYSLFEEFKKVFETTKNFSEIIKLLIPNFKEHGQEISKLLPKLIDKKPGIILNQEKELTILKEGLSEIKKEFNCEIIIKDADTFNHEKSRNALPGKPALIIQ